MSLFNGVENFTPALEGQRIAIGAGAAMSRGIQGIEEISRRQRMAKKLDELRMQYERGYQETNAVGNANWETQSMYSPGNFGD